MVVDVAFPKTQVLKIRNGHYEIDFLTLRDISKFHLCNFKLVEKGRPFRIFRTWVFGKATSTTIFF